MRGARASPRGSWCGAWEGSSPAQLRRMEKGSDRVKSSSAHPILDGIEWVVSRSRRVAFHPERVSQALHQWSHLLDSSASWEHPCHFRDGTAETVRWIFVLDVLNHCFWADPGEKVWTVRFDGREWSGYWGLAAGLKRAVYEQIPITRASFLAQISASDLRTVFRGEGDIPLFEERLANLRELGRVLVRDWGGDAVNVVQAASGRALDLAGRVVASFSSFRDEALYEGRAVRFWKRAQLLVSDLYHAFGGRSHGAFGDMHTLTAFADYKLPQVLRALGIISYDPTLEDTVDGYRPLEPGSAEEVEIRAMTIWAVEEIRKTLDRAGRPVTSAAVDHWLWRLGQLEPFRQKPYHRCRTIYY